MDCYIFALYRSMFLIIYHIGHVGIECKPREKLECIKENNYLVWPGVQKVMRCGECCLLPRQVCKPTRTSKEYQYFFKIPSDGIKLILFRLIFSCMQENVAVSISICFLYFRKSHSIVKRHICLMIIA